MLCVHSRMWCGDETMMMKNCLHTAAVQRPYTVQSQRKTSCNISKGGKISQVLSEFTEFSQPQQKTKLKTLTQHITTH